MYQRSHDTGSDSSRARRAWSAHGTPAGFDGMQRRAVDSALMIQGWHAAALLVAELDAEILDLEGQRKDASAALRESSEASEVRDLAAQIKEAELQMQARRKSVEKRAASLREYLHANMEKAGIQKIECPWFVVSIKKNPASVQVDDESAV
jgi:hypothetical protein